MICRHKPPGKEPPVVVMFVAVDGCICHYGSPRVGYLLGAPNPKNNAPLGWF
jgi:hypothetical protein